MTNVDETDYIDYAIDNTQGCLFPNTLVWPKLVAQCSYKR